MSRLNEKQKLEINFRNTVSIAQRLKDMDSLIREYIELIGLQNQKIATLESRVSVVENEHKYIRIADMGNGPTA